MSKERLVELLEESAVAWDKYIEECFESGNTDEKTYDEFHAEYLLANGVIVPPCKVGDEINGEIVHQIEYVETLDSNGKVNQTKKIHTCDKEDAKSVVFVSHPITWEEVEAKLKGVTDTNVGGKGELLSCTCRFK